VVWNCIGWPASLKRRSCSGLPRSRRKLVCCPNRAQKQLLRHLSHTTGLLRYNRGDHTVAVEYLVKAAGLNNTVAMVLAGLPHSLSPSACRHLAIRLAIG
jgi:16S rRNA C1402 (ribose-2'-O) methylase RsmI